MLACSPQNSRPLATTILQKRFFFSTKNAHLPLRSVAGAAMLAESRCRVRVPTRGAGRGAKKSQRAAFPFV